MSRRADPPPYGRRMTHPPSEHEPPIEIDGMEGGTEGEEGLDPADVADRLDEKPEEQPNRVDPEYAKDEGDPV